jgi:putative ABC transport system permease protein
MTTLRMAVRNTLRQKKRTFLLGGAIAFGVMVMTLVGSLTAGLTNSANERFTELLGGHIYVSGSEVSETGRKVSLIREVGALEEALLLVERQIEEIHYRSRASGEIIFGSRTESVSLDGVDWPAEPTLYNNLELVAGEINGVSNEATIIVPEQIMNDLGVQVGEAVLVRLNSVTGQQNVGDFIIGGATPDAATFGLSSAYVDRGYLNSLIGMTADQYQRVSIVLTEPGSVDQVASAIERELVLLGKLEVSAEERPQGMRGIMMGGFTVSTQVDDTDRWEGTRFSVTTVTEVMEPVVTILTLLEQVALGLFLLLLTITMVGLLNTFRIVLIERTQEIGTVRAIGMQRNQVRNMFICEAIVLAVGGAVVGLLAAFGLGAVLGTIPIRTNTPLVVFLNGSRFAFPIDVVNVVSTLLILTLVTAVSAYLDLPRIGGHEVKHHSRRGRSWEKEDGRTAGSSKRMQSGCLTTEQGRVTRSKKIWALVTG